MTPAAMHTPEAKRLATEARAESRAADKRLRALPPTRIDLYKLPCPASVQLAPGVANVAPWTMEDFDRLAAVRHKLIREIFPELRRSKRVDYTDLAPIFDGPATPKHVERRIDAWWRVRRVVGHAEQQAIRAFVQARGYLTFAQALRACGSRLPAGEVLLRIAPAVMRARGISLPPGFLEVVWGGVDQREGGAV